MPCPSAIRHQTLWVLVEGNQQLPTRRPVRQRKIDRQKQISRATGVVAVDFGYDGIQLLSCLDAAVSPCFQRHQRRRHRVLASLVARPEVRLGPWEEPRTVVEREQESRRFRIAVTGSEGNRFIDELAHEAEAHGGRRLQQVQEGRSEEHTSELQSLMRISYAVFCL